MGNTELLVIIVFLFLLFVVVGWLIKRFWIDKKPISPGIQFVSECFWSDWQTKDKKRAIELVRFNKEQKKEEDDEGDDFSRFLKSRVNKTKAFPQLDVENEKDNDSSNFSHPRQKDTRS